MTLEEYEKHRSKVCMSIGISPNERRTDENEVLLAKHMSSEALQFVVAAAKAVDVQRPFVAVD